MDIQNSFKTDKGLLYLVSTPIGNMQDMTYRAVDILKNVDLIYAEDTRVSINLLRHYDINTKLLSYHDFNKDTQGPKIVEQLKEGLNVALISDAGTPIISDPGYHVVELAISNHIPIIPIPGANAAISGLIISGLPSKPFMFYGFLDSKPSKREKELMELKNSSSTIIFYEAPHRITKTLEAMLHVFGDRKISLAREITKKFESVIRGKISEVITISDSLKGEMVIVVEGLNDQKVEFAETIFEHVSKLMELGMSSKDAIKEVAELRGISKKMVYQEYIDQKD